MGELRARSNSLDIIKGIAMIMVIMVHYEQSFGICKWFYYLQMGCPIFFVASGFGIMSLICRKYDEGGYISRENTKKYYKSRIFSIAPAWWMAFVIIFVANSICLALFDRTLRFGSNRGLISIVCNMVFIHGLLPFCNNNVMPGGWYIGTTAILYLLTPIIYNGVRKHNRRVFFVITSLAGMSIWLVLYLLVKDWFCQDGFSYFFFLVHYPSYLLGITLYFDITEGLLNSRQVRRCLPIGILCFAIAYGLFYAPIPFGNYLSSWTTALATYLVLYYMISNEEEKTITPMGKILAAFGKNSYCIYLLHAFFAYTFISFIHKVFEYIGIEYNTYFWFIVFIPIVLALAYFAGYIFKKAVVRVNKYIFSFRK